MATGFRGGDDARDSDARDSDARDSDARDSDARDRFDVDVDVDDGDDDDDDESWEVFRAARLELALQAIANPVRRFMLELLVPGAANAGDLCASAAAMYGISTSRASQHLQVLARAEVVDVFADRQTRAYALNETGLDAVRAWIESVRLERATDRGSG